MVSQQGQTFQGPNRSQFCPDKSGDTPAGSAPSEATSRRLGAATRNAGEARFDGLWRD